MKLLTQFRLKELAECVKMMACYHAILSKSRLNNGKSTKEQFNKCLILKELISFKKECKGRLKHERIFLQYADDLIDILKNIDASIKVKLYPIHRDINPENIIFKGGVTGLIDFDNVSYYNEPLVKDIVILLMYACRESLHSSRLDINKAKFVIKEYNKYRKLSKKEIELIPDLATAGAIEDFSYVYWLFKNDKKRAKLYRLRLYAETAIWFKMHKMKIIEILL